jgi:putative colanic acid biosynthesis UDP-glucose lipid carrier transferase
MARFRAKPGITGLAQIYGYRGPTAQVETMSARVSHDLEYIRNWSFMMDLNILLKTLIGSAAHKDAF